MAKPANPPLRDATDRQLMAEFRRREHISTNALLQALLGRFDAAVFAGVQVEAANKFTYTLEVTGTEGIEYDRLAEWLEARLIDVNETTEPDSPPPADEGEAEDEE